MQIGAVDGVVERVPGDIVGGLQRPGDQRAGGSRAQRRQQIPLHARWQRHGPASPPQVRNVADPRGRGHDQAGEHAEQLGLRQDLRAGLRDRHRQHPGPGRLLHHRDPHPDRAILIAGHRPARGERPAGHRPRHLLLGRAGGQRDQHLAREVSQVHHRIPGRHRLARRREHTVQVSPGVLTQDTERVVVAGLTHHGSTPRWHIAARTAPPGQPTGAPPSQLASPPRPQPAAADQARGRAPARPRGDSGSISYLRRRALSIVFVPSGSMSKSSSAHRRW